MSKSVSELTEEQKKKSAKFDQLVSESRFMKDLKVLGDRYGVLNDGWC